MIANISLYHIMFHQTQFNIINQSVLTSHILGDLQKPALWRNTSEPTLVRDHTCAHNVVSLSASNHHSMLTERST